MAVYLSPLGGAGWQFFDNNGNPLSGGLLYTYAAGTTTPQTTYTTLAGNVANANPIVLDSAGRIVNEVWLTEGVSYKMELQTSLGTPIWTKDNINGVNDVVGDLTFADITGSLPALRVSYTHTGSTFARTAQGKLDDVFSFQDFGALGNDDNDDTQEMQDAIDYVASIGGGVLMGKPGSTYKISAALTLKAGVRIDLAGTTVKQYTDNIRIFTAPTGAIIYDWALCNGTLKYANKQDGTATISVTVTGTLNAGDVFTDNTTGATGKVVSVVGGVLTYLAGIGTVGNGNDLFVNSQKQAVATSIATVTKGGDGLRLANGAFSYNFIVDRLTILDAYNGIVCPSSSGSFAFVGQITNYIASVARWAIQYDCDSATGANTNVILQNCWHLHSQTPAAPFASGFFFNACAMFRWDSLLADKINGQFVFAQTSSGQMGTLSLEASNLVALSNGQAFAVQLSDSSINIDTLKFVGNAFSTYVTMTVAGTTGSVAAGQTITGGSSGARGKVVSLSGTRLTFTQDTINANFTAGETWTTSGGGTGTVSGAPGNSGTMALLRASSATQYNQFSTTVSNFVTSGNTYAGQFIYDCAPTQNTVSSGPFYVYNSQATLDRTGAGFNITGTIRVGDTITGATSGASGVVVAVGTFLVLYKPSNPIPWTVGENVQVLGVTQATSLGGQIAPGYLGDSAVPPMIKRWNGITRSVMSDPAYIDAPGYLGLPQNAQTANYTLVYTDAGKSIVHPITDNNARTFTIPPNSSIPYPVGTEITFINMINTLSIAITSDTMYLSSAGTTGTRTLAAYGVAKAIKVTSTSWIISGTGLT